jgi:hypothetical protein
MYARHVTLLLKPTMVNEFPIAFEKEILPLLRKQRGLIDELVLITPEMREVVAISLWETKEHALNYQREVYPQIETFLSPIVEATPIVKQYETEYSTFHKITFAATV